MDIVNSILSNEKSIIFYYLVLAFFVIIILNKVDDLLTYCIIFYIAYQLIKYINSNRNINSKENIKKLEKITDKLNIKYKSFFTKLFN